MFYGIMFIGSALAASTEMEILVEGVNSSQLLLTELVDFEQSSSPSTFFLSNGGTLEVSTSLTSGTDYSTCFTYNEPNERYVEFCLSSDTTSDYSITTDMSSDFVYDTILHVRVNRTAHSPGVSITALKNGKWVGIDGPLACTLTEQTAAVARCENQCDDEGYSMSELHWEESDGVCLGVCLGFCECGRLSDQNICLDCPAEDFTHWE